MVRTTGLLPGGGVVMRPHGHSAGSPRGPTYRVAATWTTGYSYTYPTGWPGTVQYEIYDGADLVSAQGVNQYSAPDDFTDAGRAWETLTTLRFSGDTLVG